MSVQRARRMVGALSLLAVAGCVALSGLGDLEVGSGPGGLDGAVGGDGAALDVVPPNGNDAGLDAPVDKNDSAPPFDGNFPFDATPDANQPDTGGPETGPAGAGVVQCSATLQCTDGKACCYSEFYPYPSCIAAGGSCITGGTGLACDDDSDCKGQVCCITSDISTYSASSSCKASCPAGAFHACTSDATCANGTTCKHVNLAPGPIKGCQ